MEIPPGISRPVQTDDLPLSRLPQCRLALDPHGEELPAARRAVRCGIASEFAPDADSLTDERLAKLYSAIRELKPLERSLILMSLDGLSYRETANVLGLSEGNVGVKLNRIKTQLTQTLKGNNHELR